MTSVSDAALNQVVEGVILRCVSGCITEVTDMVLRSAEAA